jgi:hypothetical protein
VCPHGHDYDPFPENGVIYALKVGIALIHINMVQRVHAYLPSGCLRQINLTSGTISERLMAIRFGVAPRHSRMGAQAMNSGLRGDGGMTWPLSICPTTRA